MLSRALAARVYLYPAMADFDDSPIERGRQLVSRVGLLLIAVLLVVGLVLWPLGQTSLSTRFLGIACALLIAMPVLGVIAAFTEEIRRRDWPFVCAAGLVMLLLAYSIASKLG